MPPGPALSLETPRETPRDTIEWLRKSPRTGGGMTRKPRPLPDYFTSGEAWALAAVAPSYQVRMAM